MKYKTNYVILTLVMVSLLVVGVSAFDVSSLNQKVNPENSCATSYQVRPGNQINFQIPHFECCKCTNDCPDCCKGDICRPGDALRKHITFTADPDYCGAEGCNFHGEGDINVYNYNGLDVANIKVRVTNLYPRREVFTVWLVNDETMKIGQFRTNSVGRGYISFKQNLDDINMFDSIQIMDSDMNVVASSNIWFKCTNGEDA